MKKYIVSLLTVLVGGAGAFVLRLMENRTGFETDTGLAIPGNPYGLALPVLLAALAVLICLLLRNLPAEKGDTPLPFSDCFSSSGAAFPALLTGGIFLWILSGAVEFFSGLTGSGSGAVLSEEAETVGNLLLAQSAITPRLKMLLGVVTLAGAVCLFPAVVCCRHPEKRLPGNLLLVPVAALVIRLVLTYRRDSVNPSLAACYPELLALVFLILCMYRTASFAFHDGRTRRFAVYTCAAVILCLTTLADSHTPAELLLYGGGALVSLALLGLRLDALAGTESAVDSGK